MLVRALERAVMRMEANQDQQADVKREQPPDEPPMRFGPAGRVHMGEPVLQTGTSSS